MTIKLPVREKAFAIQLQSEFTMPLMLESFTLPCIAYALFYTLLRLFVIVFSYHSKNVIIFMNPWLIIRSIDEPRPGPFPVIGRRLVGNIGSSE
jgi:hypothetical protein